MMSARLHHANAARRFAGAFAASRLWLAAALLAVLAWRTEQFSRTLRAERDGGGSGAAGQSALATYVTVGLAGFRGIVAEALWLRVGWLEEHHRYLELVQLSEWISALDPHSADAWDYQSWNMAYNVSSVLPRASDRWRWVEHGISLLRDSAIPMNPRESKLYCKLGWLFQNKIGDDLDRAHVTYKLSLLAEVAPFLGPDGSAPEPGSPAADGIAGKLAMDASLMREIEKRYGPVDWRVPQAHSVYWATRALALAKPGSFDDKAARRMIRQSLTSLVSAGRFVGDPASGRWETRPDTALIPGTCAAFEADVAEDRTSGTSIAYGGFLLIATRLSKATDDTVARMYYSRLASLGLKGVDIPPYDEIPIWFQTPILSGREGK